MHEHTIPLSRLMEPALATLYSVLVLKLLLDASYLKAKEGSRQ